jgi:hypothetical protein
MRERLARWNEFSYEQWPDLYVKDEEFENIYKSPSDEEGDDLDPDWDEKQKPRYVDLSRRQLCRVFNNSSFEQGGRFYGGWWQLIRSEWRKHITINWRPTRELDYSNMQAAMLYAMHGLPLEGDAYSLEGVDPSYRKLLKKAFLQMINAREGQRIRTPPHKLLPPGWTWKQLHEALREKHKPIAEFLGKPVPIVMEIMSFDSEIAEEVMHSMMERDILVLPIHDSFVVQRVHEQALRDAMYRAYEGWFNRNIAIKRDLSYADHVGPFLILSPFEDNLILDEVLDPASSKPKGYERYFKRREDFLSDKPREWFLRFNPHPTGILLERHVATPELPLEIARQALMK